MMPSRTTLLLLAALCGCSSPQAPKNDAPPLGGGQAPSAAGPKASGPKPSWVGRVPFAAHSADGTKIFGSGEIQIEEANLGTCWDPRLLIKAAENRGRSAVVALVANED